LPDRLKRVEVIHDLTPAEKKSLGGEANLVTIGREESEQLEWEPSSLYAIRHVQLTYVRRPVAASETSPAGQPPAVTNIITAAKPLQVIPGGLPGPGLVAHVATSKYVDHTPLHR
jgi:transposase